MDSFPRPDIAEGIFFEYLRLDDPFSVEFIEKTVDGFPFLLSPLAQIQGVTPPVMQQSKTSTDERPSFLKTIGGAAETFTSHATGLFGAMQHGATEAAASTVQAVQSAGYSFRNLGEEMDRKREFVWKQLTALPHQNPTQMFSDFVAKVKGEKTEEEILNETEPEIFDNVSSHAPHGRIFRPTTSQWFGETLEAPDEIAPIIHPTMNKTILSLVHLYLLLLLIVSFPGTNNNRTRFVVRRSCKSISVSSSDSSLLKYGADDMDECLLVNEPFIRKEKVASPFREYHDNSSNHNIKNADSGDSNGSQQQQQQNSSSGKQFFNGARVTMKRSI